MPDIGQCLLGLPMGIGVKLITAGKEGAAGEVLGNILKDKLIVLVL